MKTEFKPLREGVERRLAAAALRAEKGVAVARASKSWLALD